LRRTARAVTRLYDDALRPSGLRSTQFTILSVLAHAGPTAQKDLAQTLMVDTTTLTRSLKLLRTPRWVTPVAAEAARDLIWAITEHGIEKLAEAQPIWQSIQDTLVRRMGKREWQATRDRLIEIAGITN
jgi:DNA-binding MarR family transcriptional regulator